MDTTVYVVDERLGAEGRYALAAGLAQDGGRVVSVGPAPARCPQADVVTDVQDVLGVLERTRWPVRWGGEATAVRCWSPTALRHAAGLARRNRCPLTLHLPSAEAAAGIDLSRWANQFAKDNLSFRVTVPASPSAWRLLTRGLPPRAVAVLPPAELPVPPDWHDPCTRDAHRQRARRALGVADAERLIVAPDEMAPAAGLKYAVWAHAILRHITPAVRLCMPTAGPYEAAVRDFAAAAGFLDEMLLPRSDVSATDALSAADAVVFVREDDLGLTMPATARTMNLPIVATATPDMRAFLATHGVFVPPKDPRQLTTALLKMLAI